MARTARQDLDYFPMDVWFDQEDEIKLIESEFGNQATTLYLKLIARIYRENNGYWKEWNDDKEMIFAKDINEKHGYVHEVIQGCLRRGLFDQSVYESFGVLTSRGIQKRYIDIVNQLGRKDVVIVSEYWVYDKPLDRFQRITPDVISISSDETSISYRGNDLKENESKIKESKPYVELLDFWNEVNDCRCRVTDKKKKQVEQRLKVFSIDEIKTAIENRSKDSWINSEGSKFKCDWNSFFRNDEKVERYLNQAPNSNHADSGYEIKPPPQSELAEEDLPF